MPVSSLLAAADADCVLSLGMDIVKTIEGVGSQVVEPAASNQLTRLVNAEWSNLKEGRSQGLRCDGGAGPCRQVDLQSLIRSINCVVF